MEPPKAEFVNSGDSDVSTDGTPSQFLLLRGLEPTVSEELLAKGAAKLYKPSANAVPAPPQSKKGAKVASTTGDANLGAREGSLRRVLLVRDRRSRDSWRYGFAEFASVEVSSMVAFLDATNFSKDAQAALTRYNSFEKFTISSKPVTASFIHTGVFVPVFDFSQDIHIHTFCPWGNTATRLKYWDDNAYASELVLAGPEEKSADIAQSRVKNATEEAALAAHKEGIVAAGEEAEAKSKKRKVEAKESAKLKKVH